jgi:hypothetical protein
VPRRFLKHGDCLTVADPCGPADKTLLEELPMLCAVGLSNLLPTSSPNASAMASAFALSASSLVGADHACISGVMAFTTSIAVKAPSPQISRKMVSAADAADASSSPTSPARINSVQFFFPASGTDIVRGVSSPAI